MVEDSEAAHQNTLLLFPLGIFVYLETTLPHRPSQNVFHLKNIQTTNTTSSFLIQEITNDYFKRKSENPNDVTSKPLHFFVASFILKFFFFFRVKVYCNVTSIAIAVHPFPLWIDKCDTDYIIMQKLIGCPVRWVNDVQSCFSLSFSFGTHSSLYSVVTLWRNWYRSYALQLLGWCCPLRESAVEATLKQWWCQMFECHQLLRQKLQETKGCFKLLSSTLWFIVCVMPHLAPFFFCASPSSPVNHIL